MVSRVFGAVDYLVFVLLLLLSASIGVYYGCSGDKQRTANEFLMANRSMGILPICLSLLASFLSGIALIGTPAEVYLFGCMSMCMMLGLSCSILVASFVYLPVFYKCQLTSAYEYLDRRFNKGLRICGSIIYIIHMVIYMAIVTYAPALALSQVTGIHRWGCVAAIGGVCIFYTSIGGMKAVMWTDAAQIVVMYASMLVIVIKGCLDLGGIEFLWRKNREGGRLNFFDFNPDPTVRHTFWSLAIGGFFTWLSTYGTNQAQVQRFLTSPTQRKAQIAVWLNIPGFIVLNALCTFTGLILYARYYNCDPVKSGQVEAQDQMLPLFVMELLGDLPGLPGLFVAGVFSGALSTLSSGLNSLAAVTLEDLVKVLCLKDITDERAGTLSKVIAVMFGIVSVALVAAAENLGNITQAALSIFGMISGPILGVFTLGMLFPWANSLGAGVGLITGFAFVLWIGIGAIIVKPPKPFLPVSTEGCQYPWNVTLASPSAPTSIANPNDIFPLYKVSYMWYSVISCSTVIVIGLIVSCFSGLNRVEDVDPDLLSPLTKWILRIGKKDSKGPLELVEWKQQALNDKTENSTLKLQNPEAHLHGTDNPTFETDEKVK